ncbi:Intracellular septation protein A [Jannaschia sp. EhC01]|uniref:Inner membrane-spanning protein YciB n=1 Tax=Gymnodinialimonas phycosphaerae TaxID=2841589 RepID=A0A975TUC1_9RHOB|nr:inner membrane-spanning protein YciB [Gymnodinialimonas phycosphaerae]MBY4895242.1 septation protein IspZ [Gymnodinialimonas phycosphaerae]OAN73018.1 Intracellular septation protein A [Jannaschia sp. EhC01]
MAEKQINPWLKNGLELGPPLLFFIAYLRLQDKTVTVAGTDYDGFILATAIFVPILLASTAILWKLTGVISRIQVFTAILVVFFGALTIWFNDDRFFKMKTTIVYAFFAGALGIGLLRGQSYLKFLMGDRLPMADEGWMIMTKRLALAFVAMGVTNEIVWRTQSDQFWVTFETFALPAFLFVVFMSQAPLIERFSLPDGEDDQSPGDPS